MPLIQLLLILIVIGVLLWLVNTIIPMDANIKKVINVVVLVVVVLWVLSLFFPALWTVGPRVGPR
jgi:hypothetical protein